MSNKHMVVSEVGNKQNNSQEQDIEQKLAYFSKLPYTVILERIDEDNETYWVARIAELPHCLIHGSTSEEAVKEIEAVKMDWIESNLRRGLPIPEPTPRKYSGQIRLRISPSLHRALTYRAGIENISLNQFMAIKLAESIGIAAGPPKSKLAKPSCGATSEEIGRHDKSGKAKV